MKNKFLALLSVLFNLYSTGQSTSIPIKIKWVDNLSGDFSFTKKWSYHEGIYRNEYGQLSCDGFCAPGVESMIDSNGKILKDSIQAFYKLVDTTHLRHSFASKGWCYEWAETDFIDVLRHGDSVSCYTWTNAAMHCTLQLKIINDTCTAIIDLNSIVPGGDAIYYCTNGYITIDRKKWLKGIMKAEFNFNFGHPEDPKKPIYWKGKIYSKIVQTRE